MAQNRSLGRGTGSDTAAHASALPASSSLNVLRAKAMLGAGRGAGLGMAQVMMNQHGQNRGNAPTDLNSATAGAVGGLASPAGRYALRQLRRGLGTELALLPRVRHEGRG